MGQYKESEGIMALSVIFKILFVCLFGFFLNLKKFFCFFRFLFFFFLFGIIFKFLIRKIFMYFFVIWKNCSVISHFSDFSDFAIRNERFKAHVCVQVSSTSSG